MSRQKQQRGLQHPGKTVRLLWLVLLSLSGNARAGGPDNVLITGSLVSGACTLKTTDITVNTGPVRDSFFYTTIPARTAGAPFDIVLQDCALSVARSVTVTFRGTEDTILPGLLLPSGHRGLAFGIETPDGHLLPVNATSGPIFSLNGGETILHLRGFIQAEPDAVTHRTIVAGPVGASATFSVDYP